MTGARLRSPTLARVGAQAARDPLQAIEAVASRGDAVRIKLGPLDAWLLNRPELVRYVFVDARDGFDKGKGVSTRFLGNSLISLEGSEHARRRRLVEPALTPDAVRSFGSRIGALANATADGWQPESVVDAQQEMAKLNTRIAIAVFFGLDPSGESGRALAVALDRAADAAAALFLPSIPSSERLPLPGNRRFARARAALDQQVLKLIRQARASEPLLPSALSSLISVEGLSDGNIRDELVTMYAGHRSATFALTWTLHLLSTHPEIDRRLEDEAPEGPFARAVVAEALRLYPPIWIVARRALRGHQVDGLPLRRGATAVVSAYLLHRDERYWARPREFDPARWLSSESSPHPPFAYLPFGAGPRSCIGEGLEWTELPLVLAAIRSRWRLRPTPGVAVRPLPRVMLRAKDGVPLRAEKRS